MCVEVVREREVYRGVVVVARSEEDCDVECASVFVAVVQKVMEAKTEFCHVQHHHQDLPD